MKLAKVSTSPHPGRHRHDLRGDDELAAVRLLHRGHRRRGWRHQSQLHRAARHAATPPPMRCSGSRCVRCWWAPSSGALIARPTAALLGRKRPMIIAAILFLVSAVGSAYPGDGPGPGGWHAAPDRSGLQFLSRDRRRGGRPRIGDRADVRRRIRAERGARSARRIPADRHHRRHDHRVFRELGHRAAGR